MSDAQSGPVPTQIQLHQKSRILQLTFDDGSEFRLSCEYLRVFSPAADNSTRLELVTGKEQVGISRISPVGQYAVQLHFDDGHDTGVYSWKTLYELGRDHDKNWAGYLKKLEGAGIQRQSVKFGGKLKVRLLYFVSLPAALGKEAETVQLPDGVSTVGELCAWLPRRSEAWSRALEQVDLTITINKSFTEDTTPIEDGDEIAIVPRPRL